MMRTITLVIALLVIGETAAVRLDLPIPGSAVAMGLLVLWLMSQGGPDAALAELFDTTAPYFPLLFVPAAVGVVASTDVLAQSWPHFLVAVIFGTSVTLAATGLLAQRLLRAFRKRALQ